MKYKRAQNFYQKEGRKGETKERREVEREEKRIKRKITFSFQFWRKSSK